MTEPVFQVIGRITGRRHRLNLRRWIWGVAIPGILMVALGYFVWAEWDALQTISRAPVRDVILVGILFAGAHLLNSTEFWLLYRAGGVRFGFLENWMLFTAGLLANHLPAQVGTAYRIEYMRAVHGAPYLQTAAVYGANLVITVGAASVVGLTGVVGAAVFAGRPPSVSVLAVFLSMGVAAVAFALAPLPTLSRLPRRIGEFWQRFRAGFEEIRLRPATGLVAGVIEVGKYGLTAWRIQVTFALIGIHQPLWVFLVLAPAAGIAGFIALTPAALGFREGFIAAAAGAMGLRLTEGLMGATVDRAVILVAALVLGSIGMAFTYPRLRATSVSGRSDPTMENRRG